MSRVYLDHNATTPLDPDIIKKLTETGGLIYDWGNPSSVHSESRGPKAHIRETRRKMSEIFHTHPNEMIFNSGASEGNNTVLKSVWETLGADRPEMMISSVEHPSVLKTAADLISKGAIIHFIPVSRDGILDLDFIRAKLSEKTSLVSVMFANNETGHIHPLEDVITIAKAKGVLVHSDCVQALGKVELNFQQLKLDYATFSAHKFYALKGCGVLYVRKGSPFRNLIHGGAQERSRRGGTENVLAIATLGEMLNKINQLQDVNARIEKLRNDLELRITNEISGVSITAQKAKRLPNTTSLLIDDVDGEILLMSLDLDGFSVSTGAACSSGSPEPSPVLLAMGLSRSEAQKSLRISLGWQTTSRHVDTFVEALKICVDRIREANRSATFKVAGGGL